MVCSQNLRKGLLSQKKDHTGCGEKIYTLLLQSNVTNVSNFFPPLARKKGVPDFFASNWQFFVLEVVKTVMETVKTVKIAKNR